MTNLTKEVMRQFAYLGQLGITFATCSFIGFGAGYFIDHKVFSGRWSPLFMFIGLVFGIVAGYRVLFGVLQRSKDGSMDGPP